jgi:RimJ/RimL family protein N-acetyltransferase
MPDVLREMVQADLDDLLVVQREGAVTALAHIFPQERHPFPTEDVRDRWSAEIDSPDIDCFVVQGPAGELAGFAATRGSELLHFGTAVQLWGSGLAGQAHDEVLAHMATQGHRQAWLRVFEGNARARRFYERRGWVPFGERTRTNFPPHPVLLGYEARL